MPILSNDGQEAIFADCLKKMLMVVHFYNKNKDAGTSNWQ